ncbi:MAG: NUDIX hydrolase [Rhodobacteraceae bacterium]|nr:NUDIX hydrolase [Paracoccaceae bacterium]
MVRLIEHAWEEVLKPLLFRPSRVQVAALCCKRTSTGLDVLMVTSRGTGRWIIPKGWPIRGKDGKQSALQEAWEEAGVRTGHASAEPIGTFSYEKELKSGLPVAVETFVYAIDDVELSESYPEAHQRRRKWVKASDAANMVREPGLQSILRQL